MSVEGSPRDLHPIVRDDIHRIAREALRNAFRHAQADHIEAEVAYGARELRLRIRDDGKGIDPQHLSAGRASHWGLPACASARYKSVRELDLWSEVGAGTEVECAYRVPSRTAHPAPRRRVSAAPQARRRIMSADAPRSAFSRSTTIPSSAKVSPRCWRVKRT